MFDIFDTDLGFQNSPVSFSAKRQAGMGSVLSRIGAKKPKMSTLEKSKLDWDSFKAEEGITEELAIHNRGKEGQVYNRTSGVLVHIHYFM